MPEWLDLSAPITMADCDALDRCARGASGMGTLDDFGHCFGDVGGCGWIELEAARNRRRTGPAFVTV